MQHFPLFEFAASQFRRLLLKLILGFTHHKMLETFPFGPYAPVTCNKYVVHFMSKFSKLSEPSGNDY